MNSINIIMVKVVGVFNYLGNVIVNAMLNYI